MSCPAISISTSGQRRESVRRALSAAFSAPRSSAVKRIDRLYSAPVLRALITRTRVRAGHGKCTVVVIAAWAWRDPSVATRTRSSLCLAMHVYSAVSHRSVNPTMRRSRQRPTVLGDEQGAARQTGDVNGQKACRKSSLLRVPRVHHSIRNRNVRHIL